MNAYLYTNADPTIMLGIVRNHCRSVESRIFERTHPTDFRSTKWPEQSVVATSIASRSMSCVSSELSCQSVRCVGMTAPLFVRHVCATTAVELVTPYPVAVAASSPECCRQQANNTTMRTAKCAGT